MGTTISALASVRRTPVEQPTDLTAMDNRIGLELRGKKKAEVTQLDLSGCNTGGEIVGLTEEFSALEQLDLQNASLTNIKLFPKLQNLKKLDLSGNRLSKGLEVLKDCPSLKSLSLSNNKLKEISTLEPLKDLQHLEQLELEDNEFVESKKSSELKYSSCCQRCVYSMGRTRVEPRSTARMTTATEMMMMKTSMMRRRAARRKTVRMMEMVPVSPPSMTTQRSWMMMMRPTTPPMKPRERTVTWRTRRMMRKGNPPLRRKERRGS